MWKQGQVKEANLIKTQTPLIDSQRQQEVNDQIFRHVQEMFDGKVDGDVVFIILQELEWNVEKAINSLCTMCGSKIDASKKSSKLAEIAKDVLCLDKKTRSSQQQSSQNLMPSEFPALGSHQSNARQISREPTPATLDINRIDNKLSPHTSPKKANFINTSTDTLRLNANHSYMSSPSVYSSGNLSSENVSNIETSPRHIGVIGEKLNRKSGDISKSTGNFSIASTEFTGDKNTPDSIRSINMKFTDYPDQLEKKRSKNSQEVQRDVFPSFHDKNSSNDIEMDFSRLVPNKLDNLRSSSHNSLDDIDDNFEEELDFTLKKEPIPPVIPHISQGIGHSILAGALNLTTSIKSELPTPTEEKFPSLSSSHSASLLSENKTTMSSLWQQAGNERKHSNESKYMMSGFSSPKETSRYSFANKSALSSRHDSGDFDIDSLLKEGTYVSVKESTVENQKPDLPNFSVELETSYSSQDSSDLLDVENRDTIERPKSAEMQLPIVSFELSASAKEFVPRIQKGDEVKQGDEQVEDLQPHFVMPKMGKPSMDGSMPLPHSRMPNQYGPGFRQPRAPFPLSGRPPWPPRGGRGPMPRGMPPWMHFHNFSEPRVAPPFLPPGGVLPVQRNGKLSTETSDREIERVKQKVISGAKVLVILRGLPGSGKSTLARELVGDGHILSTDDYFYENGIYSYDITRLTDAHEWNRKRAAAAMEEKITPVIIDNTNTQAWEMKPYLKLGKAFSYEMEILEPNTPWKYSAKELARRNDHGVPKEHIQRMKERYQRDLTVEMILGVPLKKSKIDNEDKAKDVVFFQADFPELRNSYSELSSPPNPPKKDFIEPPRKDSIDQEVFLSRSGDPKEDEQQRNLRKNSGDSYLECSTPGSDTDSEKRLEKEFDQLSDSRCSPIPANVGYVARSHVGMSTMNLHKQLEMISKRKTLMSPPVSHGSQGRKEGNTQLTADNSTLSQSSLTTEDLKPGDGDEIEKMVDSLILENVGSSLIGDCDPDKIIEELKSLIFFMPIDPTQQPQYEKMIEEKIKGLIEKSLNDSKDPQTDEFVNDSSVGEVSNDNDNKDVWDTPKNQRSKKKEKQKKVHMTKNVKNGICKSGNSALSEKGNSEILLNTESSGENDASLSDCVGVDESSNTAESDEASELSSIKASEQLYWKKLETNEENSVDKETSPEAWNTDVSDSPRSPRKKRGKRRTQKNQKTTEGNLDKVEDLKDELKEDDGVHIPNNNTDVEIEMREDACSMSESDFVKDVEIIHSTPNKPILPVCDTSKVTLHEESSKERDKSQRKNGKRKMIARFPFFNENDRAKFSVNDWSSIKVDTLDDEINEMEDMKLECETVIKIDSETEITPKDLKIMYELGKGMTCSREQLGNMLIIVGKDWIVKPLDSLPTEDCGKSSRVLTIHRSTMTEDLLNADIEFLKNSFPTIPEADLKDVLQNCDNNVEWAADIILEWTFHDLSLSQEDKNKYLDSIFKLQRIPKSPTIPARSRSSSSMCVVEEFIQPPLLIDICMKFLEDTNIATKEDVETQLIANSEKRLLSYESNIRLNNQYSHGHEGDEIFVEDDDFNKKILQELVAITEKESLSDSDSMLQLSRTDPSFNSSYIDSPQSGIIEGMVEHGLAEDRVVSPPSADSPSSFTLPLDLPADFIKALLILFGSLGKLTPDSAEDLKIPVDYITAQRLHQCLRTDYVEHHIKKRQQISQDEALAQQLQSEMNELVEQSNKHVFNRNSPARESLHAIMEEQLQEERKKKELREVLKASGYHNTIGNRMKQKKLYEEFPAVDSSVLDEIFQANCFNYEDTVKAVEGSLGCNELPKTVMTAEAADEYEKKLIEAAKQQSLQEMIDSYSYRLKVKKEFQSSENPEYEDFRGEANLHYRLRLECFQKAQEAYRRGMKQVANFYSNQGHLHTKKIKEANENAAQMILSQRDQYLETKSTLDLHGLHVDEAVTVLTKVIEDQLNKLSARGDKRKDLFIITGRGSHSRGGVARIRPAVIRWLKQKGYNFTEVHEGLLKLRLPR